MKNYKTPSLTLRQLRHFVAVARSSSVTSAASQLAITQPALTESIRQIENQLDCQLFDRSSRRLLLTPTGEAILPMAERVLYVSSNTLDDMFALVGKRSRTLHVGVIPALAPKVFGALKRISDEMPDITFEVDDFPNQTLIGETLSGKLDLGIGFLDSDSEELPYYDHLFDDEIVMVTHCQNALASSSSVSWQQIGSSKLAVLANNSVKGAIAEANQESGVHCEPTYQTKYIESLAALIQNRCAVGILPRLHAEFIAGTELVIRPLVSPSTSIEIVLFNLNQRPHVPLFIDCHKRLIQLLTE